MPKIMMYTEYQMKTSSDDELVAACCEGHQDAWAEFIQRFGRLVYSVAMKRGCTQADAEEVFQQTFSLAWQHLSSLREVKGVRSWLVTTAIRECWRTQKKESKHAGQDLLPGDRIVTDQDQVVLWERQDILRKGLDELGDPCKTLLTDLFNKKNSENYAKIAERLGISIGSVGPTRGRCFTKLRMILNKLGLHQ